VRTGSQRRGGLRSLSSAIAIAVVLPLIVAFHWSRLGWRDQHVNYPSHPLTCAFASHANDLLTRVERAMAPTGLSRRCTTRPNA
jgi:hypothetical protein